MATTSTTLTTKVASGSPYQLSNDQVLKASSALLRHIKAEEKQKAEQSDKKNLLAASDDDEGSDAEGASRGEDVPVWLILTTKKHIVDKNRLKPSKIQVPHSLNTSPALNICLITADPQRAVKDVVADPAFPKSLSSRITKVIGFSKLKAKYQSFESRRQLLGEHDIFLADDRIITRLVDALGKIFYKSTKRPIPIRIEEIQKVDGKRVKKEDKKRPATDERHSAVAGPEIVAKEIERTLHSVSVHLAPATTVAVRVANASFSPEQVVENLEAVVTGMIEKHVSKGWRNIKAIHIKGPNTMALPVWLASELWVEDTDVRENEEGEEKKKAIEAKKASKKRKSTGEERESTKSKKSKTSSKDGGNNVNDDDDDDAKLIVSRKAKLRAQKAQALSESANNDSVNKAAPESKPEEAPKAGKKKRKSVSKS
ncbi:hypothetical protein AJ80_05580 [Polytolypa hystricis UAMH7299]|uniref:Ribosomal protein L1 n=1 Tax=Polytolypa hystricis (strain UAMH7299) TaxID=1447883 RepID=A0A2B7Y1R5_POLH7|nr:hypothetical protein AJ80_05580 [Polytolypa hystricis UAMH7299]